MTENNEVALKNILTAEVLMKHLGISKTILASWRSSGLPYLRPGRATFYVDQEVAAWLLRTRKKEAIGEAGAA